MSFYNGIKIGHDIVDNRDWRLNSNTISLNDDVVIDVPSPFDDISVYRATLGHKANHHFDNNVIYDLYEDLHIVLTCQILSS